MLAGLASGYSGIADLALIELVAVAPGPVDLEPVVLGPVVLEPVDLEPVVLGPAVLGPAVLGPADLGSAELEVESLASRGMVPGPHLGLPLVHSAAPRSELDPAEWQRAALRQLVR